MTNADHIRKMDDEALARFLLDIESQHYDFSQKNCKFCDEIDCRECLEVWLKSDAKDIMDM